MPRRARRRFAGRIGRNGTWVTSSFQRKLESHAAGEALAEKDPSLRWGDDERSYHPAPQVGIGGLAREIGAHGRPQGPDAVLDMRGARPFGGRLGKDGRTSGRGRGVQDV